MLTMDVIAVSFSTITDASNAAARLTKVFEAEVFEDTMIIDEEIKHALVVENASFSWDAPPPEELSKKKGKGGKKSKKPTPPVDSEKAKESDVFKVEDIDMTIPRGQLVAIVGAVGAGKTSLLQGIIGEMRRTKGSVKFGGSVGYCPQSAWIQNATVRENICFGRPFDENRYWDAIRDSCLGPDLEMLPNGDLTEVGEKASSFYSIPTVFA